MLDSGASRGTDRPGDHHALLTHSTTSERRHALEEIDSTVHRAPLVFLSGADFLSAFTQPQLEALSLGFLRLRDYGHHVGAAYWGLWLFPFGVLVMKSGFIPRLIGVLLIVGCFGYVALSFTGIVFPAYLNVVNQIALPFYAVGEIAILGWLLVKGGSVPLPEARLSHAS